MAKSKSVAEVEDVSADATTNDIVVLNKGIAMGTRQDAVQAVKSLAALQTVFQSEIVDWDEIEPSFPVIKKDVLDGIPFVIAGFRLNESDKYASPSEENPDILEPSVFMSLLVAPYDENTGEFIGPWAIVNDGSTGVMRSLVNYVKRNFPEEYSDGQLGSVLQFNRLTAQCPPITCSRGLRVSEYSKTLNVDGKDKVVEAKTWYIA
jgi:hypothetical protein